MKTSSKELDNPLNESLKNDLDAWKSLPPTENKQSLNPNGRIFSATSSSDKGLESGLKSGDGIVLKTEATKAEDEILHFRINASQTKRPSGGLVTQKHRPGVSAPPSEKDRVRSPRSVHFASKYTETAEIGIESTPKLDLSAETVDDDSSYDEYDYDYTDQTLGTENDQLQFAHTGPPEYMVHLFHMLKDKHYEVLKDTVVTSFANRRHEGEIIMCPALLLHAPLISDVR
ncbi:hypothetical protein ElyMa_000853000 [Elysia marginata]|uniref:PDZ domain-containing protein n=1 Tax=Elysia marginata TaxID=1093978 RepID=A0AAV4H0X8_9GAST|nr:hypothetical protein ElyMa_000853000 [Elysia marginata]